MASQDSEQAEVLALLKDVAASSLDILRTLEEQGIGTSDTDEDDADRQAEDLSRRHAGADVEPISVGNNVDDSRKNVCDTKMSPDQSKHDEDLNEESVGADPGLQNMDNENSKESGPVLKSAQEIKQWTSNMSVDVVLYGSKLRRKVVEMQNDNRLCDMFENNGNLDEKKGLDTGGPTLDSMTGQAVRTNMNSIQRSEGEHSAEAGQQPERDESESLLMRMFADDYWVKYANEEIHRARKNMSLKETGLDTVICLDMSDSMTGEGWRQALDFINSFLDGIAAQTTLRDEAFENISLITFGKETCVQQYFTCDMIGIKQKLNKLTPGGKSPLTVGLMLCQAVLVGSAGVLRYGNLLLAPRVFLVTDGNFTSSGSALMDGPDRCEQPLELIKEQLDILNRTTNIKQETKSSIYPVPVGNFNMGILEEIAKRSDGAIVSGDDLQKYVSVFKNFRAAGQLNKRLQLQPWLLAVEGMGDTLLSSYSEADREQIKHFMMSNRGIDDEGSDSDDEEIHSSLPLGSRVQKTEPATGDRTLVGTVTRHMRDDHVGVTWDRQPHGGKGPREKVAMDTLHKVDTARKLRGELIAIGCRVRRGPDWRYSDQDGRAGVLGYVFKVKQNGIVNVRWDIGTKNTYRFGSEGYFDLEIVDGQGAYDSPEEPGGADDPITRPQVDTPANDIRAIEEEMNKKNTQKILEESDSVEKMNQMNLRNAQSIDSTKQKEPEERESLSVVEIVSTPSNSGADSVEQAAVEGPNAPAVQGTSEENKGARPKVKAPVISAKTVIQWQWQDGDTLHSYTDATNAKIEEAYQRNSAGSVLVLIDQQQYRIIFKRMEQVHIQSRDKTTVVRTCQ